MKLVIYLFKRFMPIFIGALGFFSLVLVLVDLLMNLWKYIQNESPLMAVLTVMLLYLPKTLWYAVPLGILFAVSYTLSDLYANNELVALFASGVSLVRFTAPLLIFSALMSFALFFFEDNVVVPTLAKKKQLQDQLLDAKKSLDNERVVVLSNDSMLIYKASMFDDTRKRLLRLYLVFRHPDKTLRAIIYTDLATFNEEDKIWHLQFPVQWTFHDGTLTKESADPELLKTLTEPAETFRNNSISIEEVNTRDARAYIRHLKRTGLPYNEEESVYYKKFSFPCIVFIVVFLSIGLSGKSRKNVLLISLSLSISAAVLFYVMQMITMLMAKFYVLTPFLGAWFPVFFFVILALLLLKYART